MRETFKDDERALLLPWFTNVEEPVFGLRLPQEVAGALFSRYSRTAKSLRRVFLDEFLGAGGLPEEELPKDPETALRKAREFYDRVLVGYGDDSVAQLGGAHVACERVSNVGAKLLEDNRIGIAYLEKSTRYVRFDQRDEAGEWLFFKEPRILASPHRDAYLGLMDALFSTYARQIDPLIEHIRSSLPIESVEARHPKTGEPLPWEEIAKDEALRKSAERAYAATVRAHACDVMRAYLPAATLTNVGIFAAGQAYEHLLTKLASQGLSEGRELAASMRRALDPLIPSFVKRAGESEYLTRVASLARTIAASLQPALEEEAPGAPAVRLVDFDPDAEERIIAALLYPHLSSSLETVREAVRCLGAEEREGLLGTFVALRRNRRDKPGRALESVHYTFDLLANLGIYRDLQRHRLLSQERQLFTTDHGYDTPKEIEEVGFGAEFRAVMERAREVHDAIRRDLPLEAQYAVPFAYRVRWSMRMNLREAVFLCELRSMPQGHPDYRAVVKEMWRLIERAHPALSSWARFLNRDTFRLGRLQSELRTELKKSV